MLRRPLRARDGEAAVWHTGGRSRQLDAKSSRSHPAPVDDERAAHRRNALLAHAAAPAFTRRMKVKCACLIASLCGIVSLGAGDDELKGRVSVGPPGWPSRAAQQLAPLGATRLRSGSRWRSPGGSIFNRRQRVNFQPALTAGA